MGIAFPKLNTTYACTGSGIAILINNKVNY